MLPELSRQLARIMNLSTPGPTIDQREQILDAASTVDTWEELPDVIIQLLAKLKAGKGYGPEPRAARLSTLERRIVKDSDQCPQCVANNDPNNVPVHPNCHCDVYTDSIETGTVEPGHRLLDVLSRATANLEIEGIDVLEDTRVQLVPETISIVDEEVRWADLARWLEQMQPYLEQTGNMIAIVSDEDTDEAAAEIGDIIALAATDVEAASEALRTKKFWFAIVKAVI